MKYKSFFENSTDAMLEIEDGRFVDCNPATVAMLGYDRKAEFLHVPPAKLSPEFQPDGRASAEKAEAMIRQAVEQGNHRFEWDHLRKDGTILQVEVLLTSIPSDQGIKLNTVWRDISERKQVEQALRKSEEQLRTLIDAMPDIVCFKDGEGRWLEANKFDLKLFQLEGVDYRGKTDAELAAFSPFYREAFLACRKTDEKAWLAGGITRVDETIPRPDGSPQVFDVIKVPMFHPDGQRNGLIVVGRNITERKLAELEAERLMAAIEQVAETIVITDVEGTVEYVNPAFERISGYTRAEVIGQNPRILGSGERDANFYQAMWKTLRAEEPWTGRFSNRRKDGTLYIEEAMISPVKDIDGKIINYVAIKTDITVELAREKQLRQIQKMESIGRLAGGVAHDFNNILQTITGFCGLMLADMGAEAAHRMDVIEIQKAARLAGDLTQQLLAFSREQPVQYAVVDLNAVLSDGEKMLRQALDENFQLRLKKEFQLNPVNADASQMMQIALNLIVNARDAMPDGGIITLSMQNVEITKKDLPRRPTSKVGKWVEFSVSDTGCGMDSNQLAHLFDPFYTTKEPGQGTGLGLSVVFGIVEDHGGWISVSSKLGQGTLFQIGLPVHDAAKSGEPIEYDAFHGKRILLVEDDAVIRELTAEILLDVGYAVSVATDADEAGQRFAENNAEFDLLFSDVVLPDGNGLGLADALLEQKPGLPVLLFSGHTDELVWMDRIKEKGFGYIRKPFNLIKLLEAVARTITAD